jgi:hypothetical protein
LPTGTAPTLEHENGKSLVDLSLAKPTRVVIVTWLLVFFIRRDLLLSGSSLVAASALAASGPGPTARAQEQQPGARPAAKYRQRSRR